MSVTYCLKNDLWYGIVMAKPINITYYTGHCEIVGGDLKYLFELIEHLNESQFTYQIYTDINKEFERKVKIDFPQLSDKVIYLNTFPRLFSQNPILSYVDNLSKDSAIYHLLNIKLAGRKIYEFFSVIYNWLTFKYCREFIRNTYVFYRLFKNTQHKIDIFHFNNGGYPGKRAGIVAVAVARWFKIPKIIMTIHNEPKKRSWYRLSDWIFDYVVSKFCTYVTVPSKIIKKQLHELRKIPLDKIYVSYCGLADRTPLSEKEMATKKSELNLNGDDILLLISGNYEDHRKGHDVLMQAIKNLVNEFPTIKLLIAGDGTPMRKQMLIELASQLGITDHVKFLGYRTDIHDLNCIIDIAVVPSKYGEATPYTIKEAEIASKPVITTNIGGCPEAIEHNETGLIIAPDNVEDLTAALETLLHDPMKRKVMGEKSRQLFLDRFLLEDRVKDIFRLYLN